MTAEATLPRHRSDPEHQGGSASQRDAVVTTAIPTAGYYPIAEPPATTGILGASRRIKRLTETREIRVRTTHRRRKVFARGGVLAGFGLAMVVYPVMGNVVEYHPSADVVPGVVLGETPSTGFALLGDGPALIPTVLDLPNVDDQAKALAADDTQYTLSALPNCVLPAVYEGENGKLGADQLCTLPWGNAEVSMRADAAMNLAALNEQFYAKFGRNICLYEGYRSYGDQVATKARRGYLAAAPGSSMHGMGLAFDLCDGDYTGASKTWLDANAASFGFENPAWAQTRKYEPWHWEYKPGTDALGVYGNSDYWNGAAADGSGEPAAEVPATSVVEPAAPEPTVAPRPPAALQPKPTVEPEPTVAPE